MRWAWLSLALMVGSCSFIPGTDAHTEKAARSILSDTLFDADSAKFRNLREVEDSKDGLVICGEVNAKNRMGAYIGFRRFVGVPKDRFSAVDPQAGQDDSEDAKAYQAGFEAVWPTCSVGRPATAAPSDEGHSGNLARSADEIEAIANTLAD